MPHSLAEGLRRRGIDVSTTAEAGLIASDDRVQRSFLHLLATVPRSLRAIWRLPLAVRAKRDPRGHEGREGRFVPASAI